jgi:hypothetical protein
MIPNVLEVSPIVDCDAIPTVLPSCVKRVVEHYNGGLVDCTKLQLFVTPEQEAGHEVSCEVVRWEVKDMGQAGICELMHFFRNQSLIPVPWKDYKAIGFPGTVVEDGKDRRCVLSLCWSGVNWYIGIRLLGYNRSKKYPVAIIGRRD